jgi:protein MBA1
MYTAFAEDDSNLLRKICTDGIYDSFRARIASRARGEKVQWELVKYNKRTKLVSNRAASMGIDGAGIMQAVVKISSRQRLTRYTAKGRVVPGTGQERDVVEYVVLQRMYWQWKEEEWKVWGTTEQTTLEDVEEWERKALA